MRRSVHPLTSLCFIVFSFIVALVGSFALQIIVIIALLGLSFFIPKRKQAWKKIAYYVIPIGCLLVIVNSALGLPVHQGLAYALRFMLLITPLLVIVHATSPTDFSLGLRTVHIPSRLNYLFLFSFEIVQTLREVFQSVYIAQQLRGLHVTRSFFQRWKNIFPLLLPVTFIAISQSLDRSLAYEFKGIESPAAKTYLRTLPLSFFDKLAIVILLLLSCAVILTSL